MPYTVIDKRGENKEQIKEVCRVCGSKDVHSKKYGQPTMGCIDYLRKRISELEDKK